MDGKLLGQFFTDVKIPLLWGKRAVLGHLDGRISIVSLAGEKARVEIVGGLPAPDVEFSDVEDGFTLYDDEGPVYFFSPARGLLRDLRGRLPECRIRADGIAVGSAGFFSNNAVSGFPVGVGVTEDSIYLGGPMPPDLAPLMG
jgi:hypothetical protein